MLNQEKTTDPEAEVAEVTEEEEITQDLAETAEAETAEEVIIEIITAKAEDKLPKNIYHLLD